MSASLFRSKQHASKKNLKKLTISAPLLSPSGISPVSYSSPQTPTTPANIGLHAHAFPVIVLVAKYKFDAENENELSIEPKNYMKLIERPGNGWLRVQILDKYDKIGLIPASYVDIQVNDVLNPISLKWLNEYRDTITDLDTNESQIKSEEPEEEEEEEDLFDFEYYPKSISINEVFQNGTRRFWYKIRITFSNEDVIYIGKTYEDFYSFHVLLTKKYPSVNLPKLPMTLRSSSSPTHSNSSMDKKFFSDLQERRSNLQVYLEETLSIKTLQRSNELFAFINTPNQVRLSEQERLEEEKEEASRSADKIFRDSVESTNTETEAKQNKHQQIANKIFADSVNICTLVKSSRFFSPTAPLPPLTKSASSNNIIKRKNDSMNIKYSSYMNQSDRSLETKKLVTSNSSNTLVSYTSLIDVYDDDTEEDSSTSFKDDSFAEAHSKEDSIDTKASSIPDSKDEKDLVVAGVLLEQERHSSVSTVTSTIVSDNSKIACDKSNHFSTNSSNSEQDSIFSSHKHNSGNVPSTPVAPSMPFGSCESESSMNIPTTPTTPIMEDVEFESNVSSSNYSGKVDSISPLGRRNGSVDKMIEAKTPGSCNDYIKIKIALNNKEDDIVALRIKRTNLISIAYLKKLLSFKIYKDYNLTNHYKLQVIDKSRAGDKDMTDDQLLEYLKSTSKANLKLCRARD